jgi:hypothetical protein
MCDLYPRSPDFPGIEDCDVDQFLDTFAEEANPAVYAGVVAGSVAYTLLPIMTVKRPVPSFLLSPELRDEHAKRITGTDVYLIRQLTFLVKLAGGLCWGQHPSVREKVNLEPYPADPGTFRKS